MRKSETRFNLMSSFLIKYIPEVGYLFQWIQNIYFKPTLLVSKSCSRNLSRFFSYCTHCFVQCCHDLLFVYACCIVKSFFQSYLDCFSQKEQKNKYRCAANLKCDLTEILVAVSLSFLSFFFFFYIKQPQTYQEHDQTWLDIITSFM